MLRKPYNWLLLVLPAGWVVGFAFCTWLFIEGLAAFYLWQFPLPGVAERLLRVRDGAAIAACGALGVFRIAGLHPLFNAEYRAWLSLTPWRRGLPLPVGPVHLAPQDGVILAAMLLALHDAQFPRLALPAAFLFAYLGMLLVAFASVGFGRASYALAFGLGWVVWLGPLSFSGFGLLALLVVASQLILPRTFDEFPWNGKESLQARIDAQQQLRQLTLAVGWPFNLIQPNEPEGGIRYRDGVLLSLLVGWWTYAGCTALGNLQIRDALEQLIQWLPPTSIAGMRLLGYLPSYQSPISLMGRIFTLRWIIPGYDRVFAAPLFILLTVLFAPAAIDEISAWLGVKLPTPHIVLSLSLLAALNLGPTLRDWRLASQCRIVPGMVNTREFVEL
jgi:hypothetical protein